MTDPIPINRARVQLIEEAWRTARNALISSKHQFTNIEEALFRQDALAEHGYQTALDDQDRKYEAIKAARLAIYGATPVSLRDAVIMLKVMRDEEEDIFDDEDLARAIDVIIAFLQTLPSLGASDTAR